MITLLLLLATILGYLSLSKPKLSWIFTVIFFLVLILQFQTTTIVALDFQTSPQKSLQIVRADEYPSIYLTVYNHQIYLPVAHNLEQRQFLTSLSTLQKNFFDVLDLNLYFFGAHPFEGTFKHHFQIFPFFLLPFFFIGLFQITWWQHKTLLLSLLASIVLLTFIGSDNIYGPFAVYPFIATIIILGLSRAWKSWHN